MDILCNATATSMNIRKSDLKPYTRNLIGFSSKQVPIKDIVELRVTLETQPSVINIDLILLLSRLKI